MKSTIHIEGLFRISTDELETIEQAEGIPHAAELHESERLALLFAWRWLRGDDSFPQSTSGSTGVAEIVNLTREQMVSSAQMTISALNLSGEDTALLCLHPQYIGGKMMIVRSLLAGMDLVIVRPSSDPFQHLPFLPGFGAMVPLQIQTLLEKGKASQLNRMKALIIGGAPVGPALEEQIASQLTLPVYSTYGMTETVSHIALRRLTPPRASAYFQLLGDIRMATDVRGCLKIKGAVTRHRWLTTNDLVEIRDERHFRWLGRYDFVINSGGVKVSPEMVEAVLEPGLVSLGFNGRFLITSLPDQRLGERIVLLLEGFKPTEDFGERLRKWFSLELPPFQIPKEIDYLPAFAETPNGKVQRQETQKRLIKQRTSRRS